MQTNAIPAKRIQTKELVVDALFIALTFVFTAFINVRLPIGGNGGLIHLGNIPLFIAAIIFGKRTGALAGGIGMALFDLMSGWSTWAPFTLIIVGLMGFAVGAMTENRKEHKRLWYIAAMVVALIIKIVGYYIAEIILYGNWLAPLGSIPGNIIQVTFAAIVAFIIVDPLKVIARKAGLI
ncbi:MAG: ECF transporter S component [Lachnospiraceae bacterium]|nr:ECF transporter S component [Lachnospiraceae bacterium]